MSRPNYKVGDTIVLKSGLASGARAEKRCRIVGILPNDHRDQQYRVQFSGESFERRITETDIDAALSPPGEPEQTTPQAANTQPWLKPASIKAGQNRGRPVSR